MLYSLTLRDVVDDRDKIFRLAAVITHNNSPSALDALATFWFLNFIFLVMRVIHSLRGLGIGTIHKRCIFRPENVKHGAAQKIAPWHFNHVFECPIYQNIFARRRVFHNYRYWNIFNYGIEKLLCLIQYSVRLLK